VTVHQPDFERGLLVKHRYFVALKPSADAARAIGRCAKTASIAQPSALDRVHLTAFVTDDYETEPEGLVEAMSTALDKVRTEAFDLALVRFGHFGGELLPAPSRPLRRLQSDIARMLSSAGVASRAGWSFRPHVTLGYGTAEAAVADRPITPIRWRALDFVLVHSLLRLTIHRELGRWHLIEQPRLL
jgi:2'-5' RNA ligase